MTPEPAPARRFPLWATLIPLGVGIAGWWWVWNGWANELRAQAQALVPGAQVAISGFPYRMQATVTPARIGHQGPDLIAGGEADAAVVNRQPWSRDLNVFNLTAPMLRVAVGPLDAAQMSVRAPTAQASLHIDRRPDNAYRGAPVLGRLSIVWDRPTISTALLPQTLTATRFEAHARETPSAPGGDAAPSGPQQAQLVFSGDGVRMGQGAPLRLAAEVQVRGPRPVRGYAAWANGGTAELTRLTLADATGEVLSMTATAVPRGPDLLMNGALSTVCPETVRAAFAGRPAPSELRLRKAVTIPVQGVAGGAVRLLDPGPYPTQALKQQPPCPQLR